MAERGKDGTPSNRLLHKTRFNNNQKATSSYVTSPPKNVNDTTKEITRTNSQRSMIKTGFTRNQAKFSSRKSFSYRAADLVKGAYNESPTHPKKSLAEGKSRNSIIVNYFYDMEDEKPEDQYPRFKKDSNHHRLTVHESNQMDSLRKSSIRNSKKGSIRPINMDESSDGNKKRISSVTKKTGFEENPQKNSKPMISPFKSNTNLSRITSFINVDGENSSKLVRLKTETEYNDPKNKSYRDIELLNKKWMRDNQETIPD